MDDKYPPNLILALTGSLVIIPAYKGLYHQKIYGGLSSLLLGITSIVYHSTHNETSAIIDKIGIANFVLSAYVNNFPDYSEKVLAQTIFSTIFNATVFFIGMKYNILCFDPDVRAQTFYHMLIHLFSTHTMYIILSGKCLS